MATGALRDSTSRGLGTGRGCGKGPQGQDREGVEGSRKGDRVPRGRIRVGTGSPGAGWGWGQGPQGQGRHGAVSHRSRSSGARGGSGPAAPGEGSGPGSAPRSPWRPRRVGPGLALSAEALRARPSPGTGQASVPPLKAAAGAGRPLGISRDGASPPSRAFQHGASPHRTPRFGVPSPARVGAQPTPIPRGARPCQEPNLPRALPSIHQAGSGRLSPCQSPAPGAAGAVSPCGAQPCPGHSREELPSWEPLSSLLQASFQTPGWETTPYWASHALRDASWRAARQVHGKGCLEPVFQICAFWKDQGVSWKNTQKQAEGWA